jgi:NADH-quinone oxidoreductase subunit H
MEQNFIYHLVTSFISNDLASVAITIAAVVVIPLVFLIVYALVAILGELKIASFVQDRLGPMRTGPWGIIQPIAEVVKLLQKEDITPDAANKPLFNMAPFIMFMGAFAAFAVIPFSSRFIPSDINLGLFYIFAVGAFGVIGIVMGGWASNNKYSLLGAMRSVAQIVSYEVPAGIAILAIASLAGTLNMQELNHLQTGWFWNWFIFGGSGSALKLLFIPFTGILFLIYLVSSLAETNRTPFDIPEGESELVAGYHTEYSGMKFAMFFFAEYANMFVVSAIITILFLGGWNSPFGSFLNQPYLQPCWFIAKSFFFVFVQIWLRWTLPRLRVDQLMYVGWKVLTPVAFICFFAVSLWAMLR